MSNYVELTKARILAGNLDKPEHLYGMLMVELKEEKANRVIPWIHKYLIDNRVGAVLDIGGGSGDMITGITGSTPVLKEVLDKRSFKVHEDVHYLQDECSPSSVSQKAKREVVIYSDFLHLFSDNDIKEFIANAQCKTLIIVEHVWDDYLDLRLRLWSNGRCIKPEFITSITGVKPVLVGSHYIWVVKNG